MKVVLVSMFVLLAAATALALGSGTVATSVTAAAVQVVDRTGEPAALLLSGGVLLGLAGVGQTFHRLSSAAIPPPSTEGRAPHARFRAHQVSRTELQRFGDVLGLDGVAAFQIRDRPRDAQDAIVSARRQRERQRQIDKRARRASPRTRRRSVAPAGARSAAVARQLTISRRDDASRIAAELSPSASSCELARRQRGDRRPSDRFGRAAAPTVATRSGRSAAACSGRRGRLAGIPHGHGFIAPTSMNAAGSVAVRAARAIRTTPSSSGWRRTSSACRLNSGISSRNRTP